MKLLLTYKSHAAGARDPFTSLLPVGLLSLQAVAAGLGHHAVLANLSGQGWGEVRALLTRLKPRLVGISQFTHNRSESLRLAQLAKELDPGCWVVLGGPHATHTWRETLEGNRFVDCVVLGEGEATLAELLKVLEGGGALTGVAGIACREGEQVRLGPPREPVADLDALPLADPGAPSLGVDYRRQLEFLITSRGCPASCLFCSSPLFWGRGVRFRSPASIVAEIRSLRDRLGLIYFSFRDDTFTADRARVLELCRLLEQEKLHILWNCQSRVNAVDQEMLVAMKRAGCECIQFGVESGSPAMLKALGKRITPEQAQRAADLVRRVGINLSVYLITGIPGEGEADLKASLELVGRLKAQDGQVSPLVYYPGTELFARAVRQGTVPPHLFATGCAEGFQVRRDPFLERSRGALLRALEREGRRARFSREEFERQKALVGYSAVTQMLRGESLEQEGDLKGAARAYREMVRRQPGHPWGWLLLGALQARSGQFGEACRSYRKLLDLVPAHLPALVALGELALHGGEPRRARSYFLQALELSPEDPEAREGLLAAGG